MVGLGAEDDEAEAVEGGVVGGLEGAVFGGVAVVDGEDLAGAFEGEVEEVVGAGSVRPSLSVRVMVTKERSAPSAVRVRRSGSALSLVAGPVVLTVSSAHSLPSL